MAKKERTHNEWVMPLARPATCQCGSKKADRIKAGKDPQVYAIGEYVRASWRNVDSFCQVCFQVRIIQGLLIPHADPCGCTFALQPRSGYSLPPWITLKDTPLAQCSLPGM
jgi:hypothetical protein